jgi:hypothetical protein
MSRASGVYKRNTKGVAIVIGTALAVLFNVDSGHIALRLSSDESLRQAIVEKASEINLSDESDDRLEDVRKNTKNALENISLPIGLSLNNFSQQLKCDNLVSAYEDLFEKTCYSDQTIWDRSRNIIRICTGWLISGMAIAMGAPFWFDVLGKFMNVRNSGGKPKSSDEQTVATGSSSSATAR